ncbi:MAG: efflux RND transporter permease subunit [Archangium sp.]
MSRFALNNPLAVAMACLALVVFSLVVVPRMSVDTFPELTPPVLVVGTAASGMGPQDVEKTLTWRLEKAVAATPGVERVTSQSRAGLSVIYVWLKWGTNLNAAQSLVQQQVAFAMSSVPKTLGVIPPFVLQYDPSNAPVAQIAVYGGNLTAPQIYDYAANVIAPRIEGIAGVASASPNGGRERQINVVVDPVKAAARGLTSSDIAQAVERSNALLPAGRFNPPAFSANVYTNAVPAKVSDIGEGSVRSVGDRNVLIRDVANVVDSGSRDAQGVSVNGQTAVYLNVLRVPGGNVVSIVDQVKDVVATLDNLPPGLEVKVLFDQSTFVRNSIDGLVHEILQALVLVSLVILLFLQSFRSVLVALVAVPVSFAVILLVLYATGQSLNAFTLGGLTLSMGPLVDISVVVLEAVHRRGLEGRPRFFAALEGASSVAAAALAATLATVAVLLPVALLAGLAQKLFGPLALTVAAAMGAGYFVSMLVTPVVCRYVLPKHHHEPTGFAKKVGAFIDGVAAGYVKALTKVLPHRGIVIGCAAMLIAGSVFLVGKLPSTFFPEVDESMERIYIRFTAGTSLDDAVKKTEAMGRLLSEKLPEGTVTTVLANVGSPSKARSKMTSPNMGTHMGFLRLALTPPDERKYTQREIADLSRKLLTDAFPGVETLQAPGGLVASVFGDGYFAPIVVEIAGDDLAQLSARSRDIAEVARTVPGIRDPFPLLEMDYPEVRIETDRQLASTVGVTAKQAAQVSLESVLGNVNTPAVWVDGRNGQSYYVVTSYDEARVRDLDSLGALPVRGSNDGSVVTLGSYGKLRRSEGAVLIERSSLTRVGHVLMQTEGRDIGSASEALEKRLAEDPRTKDLPTKLVGQVNLMRTTFGGLGTALGLALMVVFMVMAVQFRSLRLPLVMLLSVPTALAGVVMALLAAGQGLSIVAMMGMLMVIGIAVSNGILMVDHANRALQSGLEATEAILQAARARFVPIAMTSLATIAGLMPSALGLDVSSASNRPLALAVVGGLASSTVISLFLVPVMFVLLAKRDEPDPELIDPVPAAGAQ